MGGRSSSFNKKSVRGGGTLLSRTVKADKDEDDFEGTALNTQALALAV